MCPTNKKDVLNKRKTKIAEGREIIGIFRVKIKGENFATPEIHISDNLMTTKLLDLRPEKRSESFAKC